MWVCRCVDVVGVSTCVYVRTYICFILCVRMCLCVFVHGSMQYFAVPSVDIILLVNIVFGCVGHCFVGMFATVLYECCVHVHTLVCVVCVV